jgi:D-3-phosphoglycerate dehydrogenase / 2-oxoglutarate reductase
MKPTAYLINSARGSLVDEAYLVKMLKENRLAGAAFDVLTKEPPVVNDDLLNAPNTIITPHSAPLTAECTVRVACEAAKGIADYLEGRTPKSVYNKEGLKKR